MRNIKSILIGLITVVLVLSLGVTTALNYFHTKKVIISDLEQSLADTNKTAANELGLWIELRKTEIEALANSPILASNNKDVINSYLAAENKRLSAFSIFWVADTKGNWYSPSGTSGSISERSYFRELIATGKTVISDPLVGKADGKLAFVVAVPIKAEGKIVGILGGNVKMDELVHHVAAIKIGQTGYASLSQADGLIIAHPNPEYVLKYNPARDDQINPGLREIYQKAMKGEAGFSQYNTGGEDGYIAYAPIRGVKWTLSTTAAAKEFIGPLASIAWTSVMTAALILVIATFLVFMVARKITTPLQRLEQAAGKVAQGDFTVASTQMSTENNEIGRLASAFETMIANTRTLVGNVIEAAEQVASSSEQLKANADQSAQAASHIAAAIAEVSAGADKQLNAVDRTTSTIERMSSKIAQVAANANVVAETSEHTANAAKEGGKAVEKAIEQMHYIEETVNHSARIVTKLGEQSKKIGQIVDTISGIAGQTDLLALNAAIEAARAGEQGRGFAVVAEEVRKLAEQSQAAAKQIESLIKEIQSDTEQAVNAMTEGTQVVKVGAEVVSNAGESFGRITMLIEKTSSQVKEISAAIDHMAASGQDIVSSARAIDQVSRDTAAEVQTVSTTTEEQSAAMQEIAASSQHLAEMAGRLKRAVHEFKV